MSEALIIVDGRPSDTLAQVLEGFGVADDLGPGWPRADLDLTDEVTIRCDDWDRLSELIDERPRRQVMAFYTGPLDHLKAADGRSISHTGRRYVIRRVPPARATLPYAHRLLLIERQGVGDDGGTLDRPDRDYAGNLFFCPLATHVDADDLGAVGYACTRMNGIMLPPVADNQASTYFAADLVALRRSLLDYLGGQVSVAWKPTALALMELVDSPILRPVLTDGGCLRLVDDLDGVTRAVLEVASTDPLPAYRAGFFEPNDRAGSTGLGAIRTALREDVLRLSPGLEMRATRQAHSWGEYQLRGHRPGARRTGSWQAVQQFLEALRPAMSVELQSRLEDRMLDSSAPRGVDYPDHGLAEEALIRDLARIPWAPDSPSLGDSWPRNTAWNEAIVLLLLGHLASRAGVDEYGVPPWEDDDSGWETTVERAGPPLTVYYPRSDASQVFRWRLHAPLGALFLADEWSRIDQADTMRIGETLRLR